MEPIPTQVRTDSPTYKANETHHSALVADLRARLEIVKAGGGEEAVARHRARGKMLPRERIEMLVRNQHPMVAV